MDHTQVDLILVDAVERKPIGRPWVTVAIDVFSRAIAGFHLSLEAPSAVSVGLCLTRVAADKTGWLAGLDVEADWPMTGKPGTISVDNAREFHSEAFKRGCAQHGITIDWRPRGQPHFGGIVERVIGTLMGLIHEAPGTTFSNPTERGKYDSDKTACLTLAELERWLAVAVSKVYHLRPYEGIGCETPLARWRAGVEALDQDDREFAAVADPRLFTIDFLPVAHRTLRRDGVVLDHITYFSEGLKPWIAAGSPRRLLVRRDPRDISRVFILDETDNSYLEVPYRDRSHPPISLWEHRLALRRLRDQRREAIDEAALFAAVAEMRDIEAEAAGASSRIASRRPDPGGSRAKTGRPDCRGRSPSR
jgi:putative transposase